MRQQKDRVRTPSPDEFNRPGDEFEGKRRCTLTHIERMFGSFPLELLRAWHEAADETQIPGTADPAKLAVSLWKRNDHPMTTHQQLSEAYGLMLKKKGYA